MSTTEHERIEELLAVRALGGLEPAELAELERLRAEHGADCDVCRRAEIEYNEVAGRLAFALGPAAGPSGMEDALMARALETPGAPSRDDLAERRGRGARRPGRTARWVAAAVAAVVLIVAGFAGGFLAGGGGSNGGTGQEQALAAYLANPATQVVRFQATGGGNLAVAYQPGTDQSYVFGTDLGAVPDGKQYQLWLFPPGGGAPAPGPTFDPPSGDSPVVVPVPADASQAQLMAVTVEQEGGVSAPTSNPVFTAPITTA